MTRRVGRAPPSADAEGPSEEEHVVAAAGAAAAALLLLAFGAKGASSRMPTTEGRPRNPRAAS